MILKIGIFLNLKTPSWSRIGFAVDRRTSIASLTVILVGSVLRLENIIPEQHSDFISGSNMFFGYFLSTPNDGGPSNLILLYIGSVIYVAGAAIFTLKQPRTVEISKSRADYVDRYLASIEATSFLRWYEGSEFYTKNLPEVNRETGKRLENAAGFIRSRRENGNLTLSDFDIEILPVVKEVLQVEYDWYNKCTGAGWRAVVTVFFLISSALAFLVFIDSFIRVVF